MKYQTLKSKFLFCKFAAKGYSPCNVSFCYGSELWTPATCTTTHSALPPTATRHLRQRTAEALPRESNRKSFKQQQLHAKLTA